MVAADEYFLHYSTRCLLHWNTKSVRVYTRIACNCTSVTCKHIVIHFHNHVVIMGTMHIYIVPYPGSGFIIFIRCKCRVDRFSLVQFSRVQCCLNRCLSRLSKYWKIEDIHCLVTNGSDVLAMMIIFGKIPLCYWKEPLYCIISTATFIQYKSNSIYTNIARNEKYAKESE